MITIVRTNSNSPDFSNQVKELDAELWERNLNRQSVYVEFNKIENLQTVVLAYFDGITAGCGCFKEYDKSTVEIKRMFVPAKFRGKGISKQILTELETWAGESGYKTTILETGKPHYEAIALYTKFGYRQVDNYGQYANMPHSVCFKKELVPGRK